jgi:pterin-4a-carbinolamine dehydratase
VGNPVRPSEDQLARDLASMKDWKRRDNSIRKTFAFKDFKESVEFLGMIRSKLML